MDKVDISVVIPVYNEAASIPQLYDEIMQVMTGLKVSYEIIFVDDGSTDGSFGVLESLSGKAKGAGADLAYVSFRKNFGKSAALQAGFDQARGENIITMDGDLQDDPKEIPNFLEGINKGYDLVSGWKLERKDPVSKIIPSRIFNFTTSLLTGVKLHDFNCGFKCYRREIIEEIKIYGELYRYIPALAAWRGFRVGEIKINHRPRRFGRSKFGIERFSRGFFDLLTVIFLTKYARRPLHFFGLSGFLVFTIGFSICVHLSYLWIIGYRPIGNRPLLLLGVLFILSGLQLISIGLVGELIINKFHKDEDMYSIKIEDYSVR